MPSGSPLQKGATPQADRVLDGIVARFMEAFDIPGAAIAVVQGRSTPVTLAFGVRNLGGAEPVSVHTQFAIGSNTKAFLAACFALLVDEGALGWDDPVVEHLPEFQMYDPTVTRMMTVRDLFVHRSGLPLGAGDLMQVRAGDFTARDVLAALPHLKPATGFRAGYAYDNCLYIVAGLLLERVTGSTWEDFVTRRLFLPLDMADALPNLTDQAAIDSAGRHAPLGPPVIGLGPVQLISPDETALVSPAGGIRASVADAALWLQVLLGQGVAPSGPRLWSEAQAWEMWRAQTIISSGPGPSPEAPERPVLETYALGWGVTDYRGRRLITHGGYVAGQATRVALLPEAGLGLAIFTNSAEADAVSALRYAILDHLTGAPAFDWLARARADRLQIETEIRALLRHGDFQVPPGRPSLPLASYAGRYRDPWYGEVAVSHRDDRLHVRFIPTPAFSGPLETFGADTFRTRFPPGAGEDAVLHFTVRDGEVERLTMKALSPLADFSFDFHHLDLAPVKG